jgi:chemotaxis protein MotA
MPMAGKLRLLSDAEMSKNALIVEGILSIKREDPPLLLREILLVFVNQQIKQKVELMAR